MVRRQTSSGIIVDVRAYGVHEPTIVTDPRWNETPLRKLLIRMIDVAVDDLNTYPVSSREYADAYEWIMGTEPDMGGITCELACSVIGIDVDALRGKVSYGYRRPR